METIVTPLDHKPFGQYSIKKSFQNYERLRHRLRFFEPAKFAYTHCIIMAGAIYYATFTKTSLIRLLYNVKGALFPKSMP